MTVVPLDPSVPRRKGRRAYFYRGKADYPTLRSPLFPSRLDAMEWLDGERNRRGFALRYDYGGSSYFEWPWYARDGSEPERAVVDDAVFLLGRKHARAAN